MNLNLSILAFKNFSKEFKLFFRKLIFLIPVPLIIIITNYYIDPANLYKSDYEAGIAKYLLEGYNVANVADCNDRLLQECYINGLKDKKEILVLGSSRALLISSGLFPGNSFYNSSVTVGKLDDYEKFYQMYKEKGLKPSTIILGVDPWLIRYGYNIQKNDFNLKNEFKKILPLKDIIPEKYLELLSISYFQNSLLRIINRQTMAKYYPTKNTEDDTFMKLSDGSINYHKSKKNRTIEEVRNIAIDFASKEICRYGYYDIYPEQTKELEKFIDLLLNDKVKVIFFLAPYHPCAYEIFMQSANYKIKETEEYIKKLAEEKNIKIVGSYNPAVYSVTEEDFYDGVHAKKSAIKKIWEKDM